MAGTQSVAPARPPAPPQPDESSRRSRAQAARTNPPAGPRADWARQQSQAAGSRASLGPAQPAGVVELKGSAAFAPPAALAEQLAAHRGAAPVDVRFGSLAAGSIQVRRRKDRYDTAGDAQAIALMHPALDPLVAAGVTPLLAVQVRDSIVTGFVAIGQGKRGLPSGRAAIFDTIRKKPDALGWLGIGDLTLPEQVNRLDAGVLTLQTGLRFTLGGFLSAGGRFGLTDEVVTFNASARATVAGLAPVALDVHRAPDGTLGGQVKVPITYGKFSGGLIASLSGGVVEAIGTVSYNTEKLSGTVTVQVTDAATAREVAKRLLPPSAIQAEAAQAAGTAPGSRAPVPAGPRRGPRAIAGWGTLNAHFSSWLTGTATVIVDGAGYVTVVGKITPPAYVPLFKTGARPRFFDVHPSFGFGVPYVARAYVGANIWLGAIATIDASLSQIEIAGVYSTDPTIFNEFSIVGTLRVAALAGLEGGVAVEGGLELLGHDVSVGAGIDLTAGLVGQLEARPTIAYRELADPQAGRRGEFSISGYVEIGAQPFLALAGRAWIKLDSPFWSPAPDKTWPKELFQREYMLGGPFGYGVDFTYVIGSGKFPELKPRKPGFDGKALMSDLMDDNVPTGAQSKRKVPATWKEKTPPAPPAPAPPPVTPGPPTRAGRRAGPAAEKMTPKPEHAKRWSAGMKAIGELTQDARKRPLAKEEIDRRLGSIQARYGFARLEAKPNGRQWDIYAKLGDTSNEQQPAKAMRAAETPAPSPAKPAAGPAPPARPAATPRPDRVRQRALDELRRATGKGTTLGQLPVITGTVASHLRPVGLERLELGTRQPDGSVLVSAAASAYKPLAKFVPLEKFVPRGTVPSSTSVRLIAEVRFTPPTVMGPASAVPARPPQMLAPTDLLGTPLPAGATAIKHGSRLVHHAGVVLAQPDGASGDFVRVVTWNTNNLDKEQNVSHAEHHLVNWLISQRPRWPLIEQIMVNLRPLSPCSYCAARLAGVLREIAAARGRPFAAGTGPKGRGPGEAILTWTKNYRWTTKHDVDHLIAANWKVHAPPSPYGDVLRDTKIVLVEPEYKAPR